MPSTACTTKSTWGCNFSVLPPHKTNGTENRNVDVGGWTNKALCGSYVILSKKRQGKIVNLFEILRIICRSWLFIKWIYVIRGWIQFFIRTDYASFGHVSWHMHDCLQMDRLKDVLDWLIKTIQYKADRSKASLQQVLQLVSYLSI
jgi:hypothetical protein